MSQSAAEANVGGGACTSFDIWLSNHCPNHRYQDVAPVLAQTSTYFGVSVEIASTIQFCLTWRFEHLSIKDSGGLAGLRRSVDGREGVSEWPFIQAAQSMLRSAVQFVKDQAPAYRRLAAFAAQHRRIRRSLGPDPDTSMARLISVSISKKQSRLYV